MGEDFEMTKEDGRGLEEDLKRTWRGGTLDSEQGENWTLRREKRDFEKGETRTLRRRKKGIGNYVIL